MCGKVPSSQGFPFRLKAPYQLILPLYPFLKSPEKNYLSSRIPRVECQWKVQTFATAARVVALNALANDVDECCNVTDILWVMIFQNNFPEIIAELFSELIFCDFPWKMLVRFSERQPTGSIICPENQHNERQTEPPETRWKPTEIVFISLFVFAVVDYCLRIRWKYQNKMLSHERVWHIDWFPLSLSKRNQTAGGDGCVAVVGYGMRIDKR